MSAEDAAVSAAAAAAAAESGTPAPAASAAAPAPATAESGAKASLAPAALEAGPGQPDVSFTPGKAGGGTLTVTQDLESDRLRHMWAETGGTLPAFEGNLGMLLMYKDMSKQAGAGAYMSGVGLSAGLKAAMLYLDPPDYARRDTSWTAWKVGLGGDVGLTTVTVNLPKQCITYYGNTTCTGGPQSASMSSQTIIFNLGFLHAVGAFAGPNDWSGFAFGIDWAPSSQRTTVTMNVAGSKPQSSSSFNAGGFAFNFETGSLATIASKMGKKAKLKLSIFFLPPTGDIPFMMNTTVGAVWY
jgi:hypothetical protein